jgi:sulfate permease, SulP family
MLIVVALAALAAFVLRLPVETIGSQFGGIPRDLPLPALPHVSLEKIQAVLPNAISFALLGAIESLLSAVVADGMTGRRHRSNCELVGQGSRIFASGLGQEGTGRARRPPTACPEGAFDRSGLGRHSRQRVYGGGIGLGFMTQEVWFAVRR